MGAYLIQGRGRMNLPLAHNEAPDDDYERLPEPIKMSYTRAEWLWLSDYEKARLVQQECEPEW